LFWCCSGSVVTLHFWHRPGAYSLWDAWVQVSVEIVWCLFQRCRSPPPNSLSLLKAFCLSACLPACLPQVAPSYMLSFCVTLSSHPGSPYNVTLNCYILTPKPSISNPNPTPYSLHTLLYSLNPHDDALPQKTYSYTLHPFTGSHTYCRVLGLVFTKPYILSQAHIPPVGFWGDVGGNYCDVPRY
jgi:hypothetical protein